MIPPVAASDPTHHAYGSKYFTHDDEMIACGSIFSGPAALRSDPEAVVKFTDSFIKDRELMWDNMVAIFQVLDAWAYLNPDKKHRYVRMGYKIIYNHYLGQSNIEHMAYGAEKKLDQCTYTGERRNCTFDKYATLHTEKHNTLESLTYYGYTNINQQ